MKCAVCYHQAIETLLENLESSMEDNDQCPNADCLHGLETGHDNDANCNTEGCTCNIEEWMQASMAAILNVTEIPEAVTFTETEGESLPVCQPCLIRIVGCFD